MEPGVVGCFVVVGVFGFVFCFGKLSTLALELTRLREELAEERRKMDALLDHFDFKLVVREYVHKPYYKVKGRQ